MKNKLTISALVAAALLAFAPSSASAHGFPIGPAMSLMRQVMMNHRQYGEQRQMYGTQSRTVWVTHRFVVRQSAGCNPCAPPPAAERIVTHRRIVGYRTVLVRRPIVEKHRSVVRVAPTCNPCAPPPQTVPCNDCAVNLTVAYIGCLIKNGQQVWQYRASNGIVYNMTTDRRGPSDVIRLYPDGHVVWAKG